MIVTETYLNNAKAIKKTVRNTFSLSEKSYKEFCSYIDDPTLILNDKSKHLFELFGDEVIDYRVKLDTEKMLKAEKPSEIYLVLEMLNEILYEEYPKYRKVGNDCNIDTNLLIENKFILFGQERKLWRFLKSKATKMAEVMFRRDVRAITSSTGSFCLGPITYSIDSYKRSLGTRTTSLRTKITKYEEKIKNCFSNVSDLSLAISMAIDILSDIVGAKNISNPEGYQAYLSFNFFDWFLASTGEDWTSCISHYSDMCYSLGLTGLLACPDWSMVLIAKKENKKEFGIEVPHIVTRSWSIFGDNEKYNLVGWYPHDLRGKVSSDKDFYNGEVVLSYDDWRSNSGVKGASWYKPFYMKDNTVPFIYADCYSIKPSKSNNFVRIDINGCKCGTPELERFEDREGDKFRSGGAFDTICENLRESEVDVDYLIRNNADAIEKSECGDTYYCEYCGRRTNEETTYVNGVGEVCNSCLDEDSNFYYCDSCNEYHSSLHTPYTEVDNMIICDNCLRRYYMYCEECGEYHSTNDMTEVEEEYYCCDCIEKLEENGIIKTCECCGNYYRSGGITEVGNKEHSCNVCFSCLELKNYCPKHEIFYDKFLKGCPNCEKEKSEEKVS